MLHKTLSRLPTQLAVEILSEFSKLVNEPGTNFSIINTEIVDTIEKIKGNDYNKYISEVVEAGKNTLPSNYAEMVQKKLAEKGYSYSKQYIRAVLSMRYKKWNNAIFTTFVEVLEEYIKDRDNSLTKLIELV